MRIGIMLRSADETGGIGVYTRNIVEELLKLDKNNEYILFYRTNTKELLVKSKNKAFWDQIFIPIKAKKEKIDVMFHPKFTVPFLTKAKTVMVVHGADWFIPPYHKVYNALDVFYIRNIMPIYFRKSDFIISVSDFCTNAFINVMPWCKHKIETVYFGPHKEFRPIKNKKFLDSITVKYNLPDRFILTVIRYDPGTKNIRKNFSKMFEAFALLKKNTSLPHKFVVVGKNCHKYGEEHDISGTGLKDDFLFPGLVDQSDLPAFYNLADVYLYPTIIEAHPVPICEAMACGCPIITSNSTGNSELAGDAALLVDPHNSQEISAALERLLTDRSLRATLKKKELSRSTLFSWEKCAQKTLKTLIDVHASNKCN
jgi:glycosyltransferase involved in cell wall biosynthesis